ncbi:MAG: peptidase M64, partial [Deltaproteobacteria bacterium]|nr:peptidase M64 [Deltaproteobacteria bacterium]
MSGVLSFVLLMAATARGAPLECPPQAREEAPPADFDRWFEDATVRLDIDHGGTATTEDVTLKALRREGPWPGSRTRLVDPAGLGKYLVEVRDRATDLLIYSRGFCTLFGEWQTTDEAKTGRQVFPETVRFPLPRAPARVVLRGRGADGALATIWETAVEPAAVQPGAPAAAEVVLLHDGGPSATALDVVIVPAGYLPHQEEKLRRDLARFAALLLATPPFDRDAARIAVRGVVALALRPGAAEPRKGRVADADGLRPTFDTFGSARYLNALGHHALRDLAGAAPYDTLLVMVNTSQYGGAGIFNYYAVFPSDNDYDAYVFIHELGHSFAGLGDEYYSSSVAYSEFYPQGVEPWEPNITALLDGREGLKWGALVDPSTPV